MIKRRWTWDEREFLCIYAGYLTKRELSDTLDRSIQAIEYQACMELNMSLKMIKDLK